MDDLVLEQRSRKIHYIRLELLLAMKAAGPNEGKSAWNHAVYHNLEPFLRGGNPTRWAWQLEDLLPTMWNHPDHDWARLAQLLLPVIQALKAVDPIPRFGCPRCS